MSVLDNSDNVCKVFNVSFEWCAGFVLVMNELVCQEKLPTVVLVSDA